MEQWEKKTSCTCTCFEIIHKTHGLILLIVIHIRKHIIKKNDNMKQTNRSVLVDVQQQQKYNDKI